MVGQRADARERRMSVPRRARAPPGTRDGTADDRAGDPPRRARRDRASAACVRPAGGAGGGRHARTSSPVSLRAARRRADFERGLSATSPGVGRDRAAEHELGLRRAAAAAHGQVGRADAAARAVGEEALHAPVLERVERDRGEPAADAQQVPRARERGVELAELVVDRDADGLEGALRRVPAGEAGRRGDRGRDRVDELERGRRAARARGGGRSRARSGRRSAPRRSRAAARASRRGSQVLTISRRA